MLLSKDVLGPILATVMAMVVANCNTGCSAFGRPAESVQEDYRKELLSCVMKSQTKAESVECRREVNRRYGLCTAGGWPEIEPC